MAACQVSGMSFTLGSSEVTDESERMGDAFGHIKKTSQTKKWGGRLIQMISVEH